MPFEVNGTFPTSYMPFIESTINKVHGTNWTGLVMMDIGDEDTTYSSADFTAKGATHTVYQPVGADGNLLMGRKTKAFQTRNFTYVEDFVDLYNTMDVVINVGAVEHLSKQHNVWHILHKITKVGGVMIHIMPDAYEVDMYLRWFGHCHNYFGTEFFENLCNKVNYEIVIN